MRFLLFLNFNDINRLFPFFDLKWSHLKITPNPSMLVHFFRSSKNYFILITPSGTLGNFENNKASCPGIIHFKFETKVFIRSIDFT